VCLYFDVVSEALENEVGANFKTVEIFTGLA
jgi:hypothetical protein